MRPQDASELRILVDHHAASLGPSAITDLAWAWIRSFRAVGVGRIDALQLVRIGLLVIDIRVGSVSPHSTRA